MDAVLHNTGAQSKVESRHHETQTKTGGAEGWEIVTGRFTIQFDLQEKYGVRSIHHTQYKIIPHKTI